MQRHLTWNREGSSLRRSGQQDQQEAPSPSAPALHHQQQHQHRANKPRDLKSEFICQASKYMAMFFLKIFKCRGTPLLSAMASGYSLSPLRYNNPCVNIPFKKHNPTKTIHTSKDSQSKQNSGLCLFLRVYLK